jgi:hypothetical protein
MQASWLAGLRLQVRLTGCRQAHRTWVAKALPRMAGEKVTHT